MKTNPDILRQFCLKTKEEDSTARLMNALNKEMSPFQDEMHKDSQMAAELLDRYRVAEEFDKTATKKNIFRESKRVHSYLKVLEQGENTQDSKLLQDVNDGG